jgi:predicted nucleic acid-binding Zn ribbon protein
MPTYVYETVPAKSGAKPRHFEFKQSMNDAPLTQHPETGEAIRRVVLGGFGVMSSKPTLKPTRGSSGSSCGSGCGCH